MLVGEELEPEFLEFLQVVLKAYLGNRDVGGGLFEPPEEGSPVFLRQSRAAACSAGSGPFAWPGAARNRGLRPVP